MSSKLSCCSLWIPCLVEQHIPLSALHLQVVMPCGRLSMKCSHGPTPQKKGRCPCRFLVSRKLHPEAIQSNVLQVRMTGNREPNEELIPARVCCSIWILRSRYSISSHKCPPNKRQIFDTSKHLESSQNIPSPNPHNNKHVACYWASNWYANAAFWCGKLTSTSSWVW